MNENEFVNSVQAAMEAMLSGINTTCPGTLISYDAGKNRAVVRPSLPLALADGRDLPRPPIHEVPVAWPMGGGFIMTWPLRPGDGLKLSFSQRSLDGWLSGNNEAPDDPRRYDISDCVAEPCLRATGVSPDPNSVELLFSGGAIRMEPGGIMRFKGSKMIIEMPVETNSSIIAAQNIASGTNVVVGNVGLINHVHIGVQTGSGMTGHPFQG